MGNDAPAVGRGAHTAERDKIHGVPYLRITCPEIPSDRRRAIAEQLTRAVNDLFFNPRARLTREELRERTTVHFVPYRENELFIAARTPEERKAMDLTVELSDWNMPVKQQRRIAHDLTPLLAELFGVDAANLDGINIRFHSYPPTDFAVGGRLLSDVIPLIGQLMKRFASR
jgi:phenylpyruvate tautomerase PptA (4-oxalocrotonate tautomerase family)